MEDSISLSIFTMVIVLSALLYSITYEPIKKWAWSDIEENKKTHGNGSFK
ncbi:hypothetical protein MKX31_16325 [Bacillus sp. FSL M8-0063]